jgi:hypothetical protein
MRSRRRWREPDRLAANRNFSNARRVEEFDFPRDAFGESDGHGGL